MISISPVQTGPQPPPIRAVPTSHLPRTPQTLSGGQPERTHPKEEVGEDEVEFVDERPAKRRKLSMVDHSGFADRESVGAPAVIVDDSDDEVGSKNTLSRAKYAQVPWLTLSTSNSAELNGDGRLPSPQIPPLPERPWSAQRAQDTPTDFGFSGYRVRQHIAVPTTPDAMLTPAGAPLLGSGRCADYFPWIGKHPEDNLTETTVKSGYFDRAPNPIEKEVNTAKASLYNAFKHRAGLESLSALFSMVLDHKAARVTFSTATSFRGPPPRVTLTEIKRKSWIRDLADLAMPLKRLSKTIPQGIRGQSLLDQCLLHFVPLSRAIWFAKCVGANEIRTLKRKGVNPAVVHGVETKWLREWTINVEQFVEQTFLRCGQSNWQYEASYTIQLASRLYAENLLDRDHYLEWMVRSLSASDRDQLPLWLMMVQTYRLDLLAFRKRGKQFTESIIGKFNMVNGQVSEAYQPLVDRLANVIRQAVHARPQCFLMPDRWTDCKDALEQSLDVDSSTDQALLMRLQFMNNRTSGSDDSPRTDTDSIRERVFGVLDSANHPIDIKALCGTLSELCADNDLLVLSCMQWCISRYRTGSARIYLVVRLCRKWHKSGADIDRLFQSLLQQKDQAGSIDYSTLYQFTFELSRSRTVSVSKYIQWLTVRGLPRSNTFSPTSRLIYTGSDGVEARLQVSDERSLLLTECCLVGHSEHVRNLRDVVLSKGGYDVNDESHVIETCKSYIDRIATDAESLLRNQASPRFAQLTWSIRAELAYHIRRLVVRLSNVSDNSQLPTTLQQQTPITTLQFCIIRDILEQLQDLTILADVLRLIAFSKEEDLLSTVTDTINFHAEAFSAMGALHPLQSLLCRAYLTLRPVKTSMPLFARSLIQLCKQYPSKITPVRALEQDFVRGDRSRAIAACSPFSDGVAESLQQAGETFFDDFEAILQTESNMSEVTLTRLFQVLMQRITKVLQEDDKAETQLSQLCQLLSRLKLYRIAHGNMLLKGWLMNEFLDKVSQSTSETLLLYLIATGCLGSDSLFDIFQTLPPEMTARVLLHRILRTAIIDGLSQRISKILAYCVKMEVQKIVDAHPTAMLEDLARENDSVAENVVSSLVTKSILRTESVDNLPRSTIDALSRGLSEILNIPVPSIDRVDEVKALIELSDPLSISHVAFRLRLLCEDAVVKSDDMLQESIAEAVRTGFRNAKLSPSKSARSIQSFLHALGPAISAKIRLKMEHDFFETLPKFLQGKAISHFPLPSVEDCEHASAALTLLYMVNADSSMSQQGTGMSSLVEKFSIYLKYLTSATTNPSSHANSFASAESPVSVHTPAPVSVDTLRVFLLATINTLELLLRMTCVKRAVLNPAQSQPSPATAKQNQQDQIKLVGLIISIATNHTWSLLGSKAPMSAHHSKVKDVLDFMFDVAATLVDDMAEESRILCIRLLKEKAKDPRVKWLLGSVKMFGSLQFKDITAGLEIHHDSKGLVNEYKPKVWEMLESGGTSNDACLGLGLFEAKHL